jgi:ADP-ribose pyrophosphatase YjhB (NUDIX family)
MGINEMCNESPLEITDRAYPDHPILSVHPIVFKDDRILLVKRAHEPSKGLWSIPGGKIELGETIQAAAQREIGEECGIEIEILSVIQVEDHIIKDKRGRTQYHFVLVFTLANYLSGRIRPASDAEQVRWVEEEALGQLEMHPLARSAGQNAFARRMR